MKFNKILKYQFHSFQIMTYNLYNFKTFKDDFKKIKNIIEVTFKGDFKKTYNIKETKHYNYSR